MTHMYCHYNTYEGVKIAPIIGYVTLKFDSNKIYTVIRMLTMND